MNCKKSTECKAMKEEHDMMLSGLIGLCETMASKREYFCLEKCGSRWQCHFDGQEPKQGKTAAEALLKALSEVLAVE